MFNLKNLSEFDPLTVGLYFWSLQIEDSIFVRDLELKSKKGSRSVALRLLIVIEVAIHMFFYVVYVETTDGFNFYVLRGTVQNQD